MKDNEGEWRKKNEEVESAKEEEEEVERERI